MSPVETVYSGAAPVAGKDVLIVVPATDTTRDPVVVVDVVVVSDEVDMAVVSDEVDVAVALAETVSTKAGDVAIVVAETVNTKPVDPGVAVVAFAQIGAVATAEDREADASDSADEAADGMAAAVPT